MPEPEHTDTSTWSDQAYQQHSLQGVSRTFALTIPQLPNALETAVGNGYLLCRIADTIEDAAELSFEQKREFSLLFDRVVRGCASAEEFSSRLLPQLTDNTPAAERDLVANTDRVIRITRGLAASQQLALSRCVTIMLEGMAYFQGKCEGDGLDDLEELSSYCYHVAGVVGEMLTDLYCDYSETISQRQEQMMALAASFGQGLQMTNILKDIWDDDSRGACWLPKSLMSKHGVAPGSLAQARGSAEFDAMLDELIAIAHGHLLNALNYTLMIPASESGLRRFCLWAIGMALLTLQRLHHNPGFSDAQQIKISRNSVKMTMLMSSVFVKWDGAIRLLFKFAARGLPAAVPMTLSAIQLRVPFRMPANDIADGSVAGEGVTGAFGTPGPGHSFTAELP